MYKYVRCVVGVSMRRNQRIEEMKNAAVRNKFGIAYHYYAYFIMQVIYRK